VCIELLLITGPRNRRIASGTGKGELHRLLKDLESLDLIYGCLGRFGVLKDDEGLALSLEVGLSDNVDDVAILGEDSSESLRQDVWLDALFKVPYVDAVTHG
jgi:hypothetical protein